MKKIYSLGLSLIVSAILVGCGSENGGGDEAATSSLTGAPVSVSTKQEAVNAISAIGGIQGMTSDSSSFLSPKRVQSRAQINYSDECIDGGSMSFSGDDATMNYTATYSNCAEYGTTINGSMSGSETDDGTNIIENSSLNNLKIQSSDMNMTMNMTMNMKTSYDENQIDTTINGTLAFSILDIGSGKAGFENFRVIADSRNSYPGTLDISGKVSSETTFDTCSNGIYTLETIEVLTPTYYGSGFSAGTMKVNGATFVFNNDGTADVTYADGTTSTIDQTAEATCN